jgi:hypothetical protein
MRLLAVLMYVKNRLPNRSKVALGSVAGAVAIMRDLQFCPPSMLNDAYSAEPALSFAAPNRRDGLLGSIAIVGSDWLPGKWPKLMFGPGLRDHVNKQRSSRVMSSGRK